MTPTPHDPVDALMALDLNQFAEICHNAHIDFALDKFPSYERAIEHNYLDHLNRLAAAASARALAAVPAAELQESVRWKQLVHMVERDVAPEILVDWINHPDRLDYAAKLRAEHG